MPLVNQAVQRLTPPVAARRPKAMSKFGDRRVDPYFWLRDKENPEVIAYLEADDIRREVMSCLRSTNR